MYVPILAVEGFEARLLEVGVLGAAEDHGDAFLDLRLADSS